jgi:hypothetical protein
LFLADCSPKPAATAFRFPFVLERQSKSQVAVWGKSPAQGELAIQTKNGGRWRRVSTLKVERDMVFTTTLRARGKGRYRATVGDEASLVWSLRKYPVRPPPRD